MKKALLFVVVILCMGLCFAGGGKETAVQTQEPASGSRFIPSGAKPEGKIHLVLWSAFSGDAGKSVERAAKSFNESQNDYEVEVIYTSNQAPKILSSTTEDRPNLFITSGNESSKVISEPADKRKYVPVQEYIDYEGYDASAIFPNLRTLFSRQGAFQSIPVASSSVGIYYNTDVLEAHGIDFNTLTSLEEILKAGLKLKAEGIETPIYFCTASVDYLNYLLCAEGITWFNNDNGRDGVPTAHYFNEGPAHDAALDEFKIIKEMAMNGLLAPSELAVADRYGMFAKQDYPIMFNFSSVYVATYNAVGGAFNFVYRPIMTIYSASKNHGQAAGGYCIFIGDVNDAWKEYGSWQFIKYLLKDEWVSDFALSSGYFPVTSTGAETEAYKQYEATINPSSQPTLEAMKNTEDGIGYCLLPFASDYGTGWKNIMKKMMNTPEYTPEQAMEDFIKSTQNCLEMYWMSQGVLI